MKYMSLSTQILALLVQTLYDVIYDVKCSLKCLLRGLGLRFDTNGKEFSVKIWKKVLCVKSINIGKVNHKTKPQKTVNFIRLDVQGVSVVSDVRTVNFSKRPQKEYSDMVLNDPVKE